MEVEIEKSYKFLLHIRPEGGAVGLTAISPEGTTDSITINVSLESEIKTFLRRHNGINNLYYTLNEPYERTKNKKLKKEDIKLLYGIYIDADPDKSKPFDSERERVLNFAKELNELAKFTPTITVDSGGGIQALWLFNTPIPATPKSVKIVEDYGRGLAKKYNTDAVQNVDRLLRLPFTLNIPNKRKKAAGRVATQSKVLYVNSERYKSLKNICTPVEEKVYNSAIEHDLDLDFDKLVYPYDKIPTDLKNRWDNALAFDEKLRSLSNGKLTRSSRSEYDFAIAERLKMANFNIQDIAQLMYTFDKGKGQDMTERDIVRCYERAENPFQALQLNEEEIKRIESTPNPMLTHTKIDKPEKKTTKNTERSYKAAGEMSWRKSGTPLLKGLMDLGTVVAIYGQSNVGKSFITADIVAHVCQGLDWGGHKLKQRGSALVLAAESGATYGKRVDAIKMRLNHDHDVPLTEFPFAVVDKHVNLLETNEEGVCEAIEFLRLEAQMVSEDSGYPCNVIVIDTLSAVMGGGNENSSDDMGKIMDHLLILAKETGATIIIVHHSGKDQSAGLRGHTKLIGGVDTSLEVKLTTIGGKDRRELIARKQRDNDMSGVIEFNLNVVVLGIDEDGDEVTSCNICLKSDSEFQSVIQDESLNLTQGQLIAYKTIQISCYTTNYDKKQMYGWYYYISKNPGIELKELQILGDLGNHPPPIRSTSNLVKKNTVGDQWNKLEEKGLIKKDEQNQWVINSG